MPPSAAILEYLSQHIGSTSMFVSIPHGDVPDVPSNPDIPDSPDGTPDAPDIPGDSGAPSNSGTPGGLGVPRTPGRPGLEPGGGDSEGVGENAGDIGQNTGDAVGGSVGLSPELTAVFSFTITIAIITVFQLWRAARQFKKLVLPEGEPKLPYDVGKLFRTFLVSYLSIYLLYNILYAILIALAYGDRDRLTDPTGFGAGTTFVGQLADVMFFATLLSIIAHRQRIQVNPNGKQYNMKFFLDGCVLAIMLILGIGRDGVAGNGPRLFSPNLERPTALNLAVAYEVFSFIASADVVVSAYMARVQLTNAGIEDNIIQMSVSPIGPVVLIRAIYRIISVALTRNWDTISIDVEGLLIADTIIGGFVSIFVVERCLTMGAPPKLPKDNDKANAS